jgi:hypothetical protein
MSDDNAPETAAVAVSLIGYELTPASGTLLALMTAEITFSGGEVARLQGLQVRKASNGNIELRAPQFRGRDGQWRDAVLLDDPIMLAILDQVSLEWFRAGRMRINYGGAADGAFIRAPHRARRALKGTPGCAEVGRRSPTRPVRQGTSGSRTNTVMVPPVALAAQRQRSRRSPARQR